IDVRNARVVWKTPGGHTAVFAGRSPSGNFAANYSHVDIFDGGGYHYFQQGSHTGKLIGYASPKFSGVQVGVAIFATNPANDDDQDVTHFRVVWSDGPYKVGFGSVESNTSTADDSTRETLSFTYKDGPLAVGLTHEDKLRPSGTTDGDTVLGLAASYTTGVHTFKAATYSQDSDVAANDGLSASTLEYSLALNKFTNVFVTIDMFDTSSTADDDLTAFGINMKW
nr:porin [Gammaproteobacteria bacterium]